MFNQSDFNEAIKGLTDKLRGWFVALVENLPNIILAAVVMAIGIFLSRYVQKWVKRGLSRFVDNRTITGFAASIITAVFLIAVLVMVLSILKLDTALTSVLGTAGVAGLAVGLALQEPIVNIFAGIMMSVREYYKVGDLVKSNDHFGIIQKISLRSTILSTPEGQQVILPNKDVLGEPLVNYSHNLSRRVDINCGVAYGDDLEEAQKTAVAAIESGVDYDKSKPVQCFFTEFGDSSINFELRYWQNLHSQAEYLNLRSQGIIALKKAFDEKGITIPFPITTLDFGVVGGKGIDEIYKPEDFSSSDSDRKENGTVKTDSDKA